MLDMNHDNENKNKKSERLETSFSFLLSRKKRIVTFDYNHDCQKQRLSLSYINKKVWSSIEWPREGKMEIKLKLKIEILKLKFKEKGKTIKETEKFWKKIKQDQTETKNRKENCMNKLLSTMFWFKMILDLKKSCKKK